MSEWFQSTVGEVSQLVTKGTTPTMNRGRFVEAGITFVKVESITDDGRFNRPKFAFIDEATHQALSRSVLKEDDILFTIAGTIGKVARVDRQILPANTNQAVAIVRPNRDAIDPRFLYYALRDEVRVKRAHSRVVQSVQANFSLLELRAMEVPLPTMAEQSDIASVLGALDEKIDADRQVVSILSDFLAATWYGRFESAHDDAGWPTMPIGTVARVVGGSTPSTKNAEFWGGTVAWATPKDLSRLSSAPLLDTDRCITERGLQEISSGLLPVGAVLLSSRAPIGYLAIAEVPVAINQGFIALVAGGRVSNLYLWQWLRAHLDDVISRSNGTTFLEVSKGSFRPMLISVPPEELMRSWTESALPQYRLIVAMERESRALVRLRDILLPKLLSGELRVREAEALVEGAV